MLLLFIACSATDLPVIQPRLENAMVYPDNGTWDQTFNYTVNCSFSKEVNITLEVYDLSLLDWKPVERGTYNKIEDGKWHITWNNIRICSDECAGTSRYRFKYNGSVVGEPYFGPKIPFMPPTVKEEFKNATANPPSGNWSDYFNYSVYVNTNKTVNIRLEVFDVCSGEWKTKGNRFYDDPGKWQKRTWEKVKPFSANCTGVASYQFIDEISKHESEIYYGPVLINVSGLRGLQGLTGPRGPGGGGGGGSGLLRRFLKNPDEYPDEKENFEDLVSSITREKKPLDYEEPTVIFKRTTTENITRSTSLTVSAKVENPNSIEDRSIVTLKLKIKHPGENELELYDERIIFPNEYKSPNSDTWKENFTDTFFSEDKQVGNASFLLEWDDKHRKYKEKPINITIINFQPNITNMSISVSPPKGIWKQRFTYTANVSDEDEDEVEVTLHILIPSSGAWVNDTKTVKSTKNGTNVTWPRLTPFSIGDERTTSEYYFTYNDGIYENNTIKSYETAKKKAPYIKPVTPLKLKHHSLNPDSGNWNDEFIYTATIFNPSEDNATVRLWVYTSGNWTWCGDDKQIEAGEEKIISWQISPFGVKDFNKSSKYTFTHLGGPIGRKEFDGPEIEDVLIPVL